jgi:uncharacterized protein YceK
MKGKVVIWTALAAVVLTCLGCASIDGRLDGRQKKLYPGVRNFDGGGGDIGGGIGYIILADLVLSAAIDTLMLPFDLAYEPKPTKPRKPRKPKYTAGTYSGLYYLEPERSDFRAVGREAWWLSGNIDEVKRRMTRPSLDQLVELHNPIYLVVKGELSEPGFYGNGGYYRELRVTRVLEIKQESPATKPSP